MTTFQLREMKPTDSMAVSNLVTDMGGFMSTHFVVDAYRAMIEFAELRTQAVVAEADGHDGLAGVASVRFGTCQFNGDVLPFAFLDSLKVDARFRRQGLGAQLAQWRVDRARAEFGDQGVLLSGTTTDNIASQNTMKKWCREFTAPLTLRLLRTAARPPQAKAGITIREAQAADYPALVAGQNSFYTHYNLYPTITPQRLTEEQAHSTGGEPLIKHYVAVTANGELVAGASVRCRGDLMIDTLNPPLPLRVANRFLRLLPQDMTLREIQIKGLWFAGGQEAAAHYLVDSLRYIYRKRGSVIALGLDPRSPFTGMFQSIRFLPIPQLVFAVHGPASLDRERLIYVYGRV